MGGVMTLIPVDHRNLRAFFARGLVTPARLTRRYKSDSLQISGDALPAFSGPLGNPWVDDGGTGDGFIVLVELGEVDEISLASDVSIGVQLLSAPLPTSAVAAVHVRSEEQATEIRSREYRNLDPRTIPLRVTPELFEGTGPELSLTLDWIHAQPSRAPIDDSTLVERECLAGGIALLADGVAPTEALLEATTKLTAGLLNDGQQEPLRALATLARDIGWVTNEPDALGFYVVAKAIIGQSGPEEPAPMQLIEAVAKGLGASDEGQETARLLEYIQSIVRGEREFGGFRTASGHVALKALLLFLLRPSSGQTKSWFAEQMALSDEVRALALLWSGLSCRFAGLPSSQRGTEEMQAALQSWMCGRSVRPVEVARAETSLRLEAAGRRLGEWTVETPSLRVRLLADCQSNDPDAVRIALSQGWDDCLETVIEAERIELSAGRGKAILRVAGRPRITHYVGPQAFKQRLRSLTDAEVEALAALPPVAPVRRARRRPSK